jgi:dTDP-4-dehydrorhamnose 3,5-epimerase
MTETYKGKLMKVQEKTIKGVTLITFPRFEDDRGAFVSLYNSASFKEAGLIHSFQRMNQSYSKQNGTLRGLHYQHPPYAEAKLIRVLSGEIWDVALDIRSGSPHFGRYEGVHLKEGDNKMFLIPDGCAHGFLTLTDNVTVEYLCSHDYLPEYERSIRWNDPYFSIEWPRRVRVLSEKDQQAPDFDPKYHLWPEHSHF